MCLVGLLAVRKKDSFAGWLSASSIKAFLTDQWQGKKDLHPKVEERESYAYKSYLFVQLPCK